MPRDLYAPVQAFLRGQAPLRLVEKAVREEGADPNSWLGPLTPVRCAVENDHVSLLELLLKLRGDPNQRDARGVCPLHMAVFDDRGPCVEALLDGQADVNIRDQHGQTPIFFAPSREICELLISRRADVDVRNIKSQSPLHLAAHAGLDDAVEWLVDASDKRMLEAKDQKGHTPLYYAAHARLKSTIGVLKKMGAEVSNVRPNGRSDQARRPSSLRSRTSTPVTMRSGGGVPGSVENQEPEVEAEVASPPASAPCQVAKPASPEVASPPASAPCQVAKPASPEAPPAAAESPKGNPRALEEALLEGLRRGEDSCSSSRGQPPDLLFSPPRSAVMVEGNRPEEQAPAVPERGAPRPEEEEEATWEEQRKEEKAVAATASEPPKEPAAQGAEAAIREAEEKGQAEEALSAALASKDLAALESALAHARAVGVGAELVRRGEERVDVLRQGEQRREAEEAAAAEERLRQSRAQEQRRCRALRALEAAAAGEDPMELEGAIARAKEAEVEPEALEEAGRQLECLQRAAKRKTSEMAIKEAAAKEDVEALEAAVSEAGELGVSEDILKDARGCIQRIQARLQLRWEAVEALRAAERLDELGPLERAVQQAEAAGVSQEVQKPARERLQVLQDQAQRRQEAEEAIERAAARENVDGLEAAISEARQAGVRDDLLQDAEQRLQGLRVSVPRKRQAQEALAALLKSEDMEALERALAEAQEAGARRDLLQDGRQQLQALQAQARRRRKASEALAAASDEPALAAAIAQAEAAGVEAAALEEAEERLEALRAQARRRREAAEALAAASEEGRVECLEAAIARAEAEGVEAEALEDARLRLQSLQAQAQRRREAEAAVAAASRGEDADTLEKSIEEAEEAGVGTDALEEAKTRLQDLRAQAKRRREAAAAVAAASKEGRIDALEAAIARAEAEGVGAELLEEAKTRLQDLRAQAKRRREAAAAVAAASKEGRIDILEAAIARAEAEGVGAELLEDARRQLRSLEAKAKRRREAQAAVAAASAGESAEALEEAVAEAEEAGVDSDALEEARRQLRSLEAKAKRRRQAQAAVAAASAGESAEALEEAIAEAEEAGVGADALEEAQRHLQVLRAQATRRHAAASALAVAAEGKDEEALEEAIQEASEAGVEAERLEEARERLQALARAREQREAEAEAEAQRLEALRLQEAALSEAAAEAAAEAALPEAAKEEEADGPALQDHSASRAAVDSPALPEELPPQEKALPPPEEEEKDEEKEEEEEEEEAPPPPPSETAKEAAKETVDFQAAAAKKVPPLDIQAALAKAVPPIDCQAAAAKAESLGEEEEEENSVLPRTEEAWEQQQQEATEEPAKEEPVPTRPFKYTPRLPVASRARTSDAFLEDDVEEPLDLSPRSSGERHLRKANTMPALTRLVQFSDSPELCSWEDSEEQRAMRLPSEANSNISAEDEDEDEDADGQAEGQAEESPEERRRWQELQLARRRQEMEAAQRREELRRALLRAASEDDPLALAVALGRAEEAGVDAEALAEGRSRLRGLSSSRWGEVEVPSGASSSWEQPEPQESTPVQPELKDGCLLWEVLLEKETEEDKFGFVQANGKLDFENRLSGGSRDEGELAALPGPQVLIVRRIHHQGLLHRWNLRHQEAQVRPQDRIISVNGEDTLEAMQREIRSTKILLKVMRYPEVFAVTLRREGRRLGFRIEYPQDSDTPEVRISQLTEGALPVHNQEQVKANMWHYVVLPDMRIQAANGASGSAWLIAEELKLCQIVTLIVRRAEHKETSPAIPDVALTARPTS